MSNVPRSRRITMLCAPVLIAALCSASIALAVTRPATPELAPKPRRANEPTWAELEARSLSVADRAAQLVMTAIPGTSLNARTERVLSRERFGGIIIFEANVASRPALARLVRAAQRATVRGDVSRPRLLVSIDQEGGPVVRVRGVAPLRGHRSLGMGSAAATRAQAAASARSLRALGVRMNLAPVADLDVGPAHVMRTRSFGAAPRRVAAHVAAFVDGLHDGGVASSVKHFPGLGGTTAHSDDALAFVRRSRATIDAADLVPFRRAIAARTDSIMMAHARYTAIDRLRPASASPAAYRMLRTDLGFDGVAITDSLHAAGFRSGARVGVATGCVRTVAAGADIALLTGSLADAVACRRALVVAGRRSRAMRARIDEAAARVLELKLRYGLAG